MPTFRNDGERSVIYTAPNGKDIIIFDPNKNVQLIHWVPYKKLGLTLVSENYPPVPNTVLISGTFKFNQGMERKFDIEPCKKYTLDIYPITGTPVLFLGAALTGRHIPASSTDYHETLEWQYAPYIRISGGVGGSTVTVQATLKE